MMKMMIRSLLGYLGFRCRIIVTMIRHYKVSVMCEYEALVSNTSVPMQALPAGHCWPL